MVLYYTFTWRPFIQNQIDTLDIFCFCTCLKDAKSHSFQACSPYTISCYVSVANGLQLHRSFLDLLTHQTAFTLQAIFAHSQIISYSTSLSIQYSVTGNTVLLSLSHTFTHLSTHQRQCKVQCLAQGDDMWSVEAGDQTTNPPTGR